MQIVEFELVNHIKLGDINLKLDNSIVSVIGPNGSGKSFLLSSMHPFAQSSRFNNRYPVKSNKTGYKRILYNVNGTYYECIHEYVPKKSTHSCKSYINKIEAGVKEELNPTGHFEYFKDIVEKHLKFNSNIFDIGFISFKSNGITSTSGVNRRTIFESTVDMTTLNKMKKNVTSLSSDLHATTRLMESRRIKLVESGDEEVLKIKIDKAKTYISDLEKERASTYLEFKKVEEQRLKLEKLDTTYLLNLEIATQYLSKYAFKSVSELLEARDKSLYALKDYEAKYDALMRKYDDAVIAKRQADSINSMEVSLNTYNDKKKVIEDKLLIYLKDISAKTINNITHVLTRLMEINELISKVRLPISDIGIKKMIIDKLKEQEELKTRIDKYNYMASLSDGKSYSINYADNCKTCELYSKFIKSNEYLDIHKDKYESDKAYQGELMFEINTLNMLDSYADTLWSTMDISSLTNETIDRFGLKSVDNFMKGKAYLNTGMIRSFITKLSDTYFEYDTIVSDIMSLNIRINEAKLNLSNTKYDIDEIMGEINKIKNDISLVRIIDIDDKVYSDLKSLPDEFRFSSNLNEVVLNIKDRDRVLRTTNTEYDRLKSKLDDMDDKFTKALKVQVEFEHRLEELKNTSLMYHNVLKEKNIVSKCRDIIERQIPILLLENNLKFIEATANTILADNDIPISLELVSNGSEVIIPCQVEDTYVPDVSCLSAGETCLVSLLLNACILHLTGYGVLCLDEIDANLDVIRRKKFNNIVYSVMEKLNIHQICCVSHNISSSIENSTIIQIGKKITNTLSQDIIKI